MNIESLINKIELFNEIVVKSGFKRDITDNIQAIQQGQNQNLVFMKDLSTKVKQKLKEFENYGIQDELSLVLRDSEPFTYLNTFEQLEVLDSDSEITSDKYYSKFSQILNKLNQQVEKNKNELDSILVTFKKYRSDDSIKSEQDSALVSLIFKDLKSTGSLKEFAKVLARWNRMLIVYHTLLTSNSPKEIELVEIQNGSIDVIFNIDFDIAIDLAELIKTGLKVYGAYLLYKSNTAKLIIESYMGNQKLIDQEKEREKLMLDNIKDSVYQKALEQHKGKLTLDKKIDKTSIDKKIDEVSSVITDHIIKGNELKLLMPPTSIGDNEESNTIIELREETAKVRETYKKIEQEDKVLLLEKYSIKDEDVSEKK